MLVERGRLYYLEDTRGGIQQTNDRSSLTWWGQNQILSSQYFVRLENINKKKKREGHSQIGVGGHNIHILVLRHFPLNDMVPQTRVDKSQSYILMNSHAIFIYNFESKIGYTSLSLADMNKHRCYT